MSNENISADLIWQVVRAQNAYLCKRKMAGGVQFSRDPMNLTNKHSRKYAGFVNDQAIGIQPSSSDNKNRIVMAVKTPSKLHKPASSTSKTTYGSSTSTRKMYRSITSSTAKRGYRPDLRYEAVSRASAIRQSQRTKPEAAKASKPRGSKARKLALSGGASG